MKKSLFYFMIFIAILFLLPLLSWAKTGYVSDRLILNFRQGPDNASAVIKTLKSDDPVIILEEENEFYKIELQSKEIGWVDKKFITFELPKTLIIDQLKQENDSLKNKVSELTLLETDLKKNVDTLLSDKDIKSDDHIENAANNQKIVQENQMYQEKNIALSQELALLKVKNKNLFKTSMIKWFLSGVGVLLIGWIIGQSISSRKRKSSSSLLG